MVQFFFVRRLYIFGFMIKRMFRRMFPKAVAIGIVSLLIAWTFHVYGVRHLTDINSMSARDLVDYERREFSHTWLELYLSFLPLAAGFVLLVEFAAAIVRRLLNVPESHDEK